MHFVSVWLLLLVTVTHYPIFTTAISCDRDTDCCGPMLLPEGNVHGVCLNGTCMTVPSTQCSIDADCSSTRPHDWLCDTVNPLEYRCSVSDGTCTFTSLTPPNIAAAPGHCPVCWNHTALCTDGWGVCEPVHDCCSGDRDCDMCHRCTVNTGTCDQITDDCCIIDMDCPVGSVCVPSDRGAGTCMSNPTASCGDDEDCINADTCTISMCDEWCCHMPSHSTDECKDDGDCIGWTHDTRRTCVRVNGTAMCVVRTEPLLCKDNDCYHNPAHGWVSFDVGDCHSGPLPQWHQVCTHHDDCPDDEDCCGGGICAPSCAVSPFSCPWPRCGQSQVCCSSCVDGTCCTEASPCHGVIQTCSVVRDLAIPHDGLDGPIREDIGIVMMNLGEDGYPVFDPLSDPDTFTGGNETFWCWHHDCPGVSMLVPERNGLFTLRNVGDVPHHWIFDPAPYTTTPVSYFPVDNLGFGNQGLAHNYHFTTSTCFSFKHVPDVGGLVVFATDDDMWIFLDGVIIADYGGVLPRRDGSVDISTLLDDQNDGTTVHEMCIFAQERHVVASVLVFEIYEHVIASCGERGGECFGLVCDACETSLDCTKDNSVCCGGHCVSGRECCADEDCMPPPDLCTEVACDCNTGTCVVLDSCDDGVACTDDVCDCDQCTSVPNDHACNGVVDVGECGAAVCNVTSGCIVYMDDQLCNPMDCYEATCVLVSGTPTCEYTPLPGCGSSSSSSSYSECVGGFAKAVWRDACFSDLPGVDEDREGWTNGPYGSDETSPGRIYADIGDGCDTTMATTLGLVLFTHGQTQFHVMLGAPPSAYTYTDAWLYVGRKKLPKEKGDYITNPEYFDTHISLNTTSSYPYTISMPVDERRSYYTSVYVVACTSSGPHSSSSEPDLCEDVICPEDPCHVEACDPQTGLCVTVSEVDCANEAAAVACGTSTNARDNDNEEERGGWHERCLDDYIDICLGGESGAGECNITTGECPPVHECDDGNPCTIDECIMSRTHESDNNKECDRCPPVFSCIHTPIDCEDENMCTTNMCIDGQCVLVETTQCPPPSWDLCALSECVPQTGECVVTGTTICSQDGTEECMPNMCNKKTGECEPTPFDCGPNSVGECALLWCEHNQCVVHDHPQCYDALAVSATQCQNVRCNEQLGGCYLENKTCTSMNPCTVGMCDDDTGDCLWSERVCPCNYTEWLVQQQQQQQHQQQQRDQVNENDATVTETETETEPATRCIPPDTPPADNVCVICGCSAERGGCFMDVISCDDGIPCTDDVCIHDECVNIPIVCTEGTPCTPGSCVDGECVYREIDCEDNDPCTYDYCMAGECVNDEWECGPIEESDIADREGCWEMQCDSHIGECVPTEVQCIQPRLRTMVGHPPPPHPPSHHSTHWWSMIHIAAFMFLVAFILVVCCGCFLKWWWRRKPDQKKKHQHQEWHPHKPKQHRRATVTTLGYSSGKRSVPHEYQYQHQQQQQQQDMWIATSSVVHPQQYNTRSKRIVYETDDTVFP